MEKVIHDKNKGILLIISSAFCFALMGIFVKLAGDLPAVEKSFFRNLIAAIIAVIVLIKEKQPIVIGRKNYLPMLIRVLAGTIGILGNFYAVSHIMVADASMLSKLSPFATIIFSMIILKEVPKRYQVFCLLLALTGAMFVIKPGFSGNPMGMAAGLIGGVGAGLAYTMVRMLGSNGVPQAVIVFFFSTFSCLSMVPLMIIRYHEPINKYQLLMLLGAGLAAAGGQFSITGAYRYAPAKEISIYDYSQIIFTTIMGLLIFGELPDLYSFIGYAIIITASLIIFLKSKQEQ